MIKVKNLNNNQETIIVPTVFPDRTSQVWNLPANVLGEVLGTRDDYKVTWHFESEAEVIQLLQLSNLLYQYGEIVELSIPYFPYARQDKHIKNDATFAQSTIANLLEIYFDCSIDVFDLHNSKICETSHLENKQPNRYIIKSLITSRADLICFPDLGASTRYNLDYDYIAASKVRCQTTGKILGHELIETPHDIKGKTILVVDDIGDGMATFISVAKMLYEQGAKEVQVYVSHGVFSKGVVMPSELGKITHYYTTNSYLPSQEMLKQHTNVTIYNLEE